MVFDCFPQAHSHGTCPLNRDMQSRGIGMYRGHIPIQTGRSNNSVCGPFQLENVPRCITKATLKVNDNPTEVFSRNAYIFVHIKRKKYKYIPQYLPTTLSISFCIFSWTCGWAAHSKMTQFSVMREVSTPAEEEGILTWINMFANIYVECNYSSIPKLQRWFSENDVDVIMTVMKTWMKNLHPIILYVYDKTPIP